MVLYRTGTKKNLKHFFTEEEIVKYAHNKIKLNKNANRRFIGYYKERSEIEKVLSELKKRGIEYCTEIGPYGGINDYRTGIFVIGCGIKRAGDLVQNSIRYNLIKYKNKLWAKLKNVWL